MNITIGSAIHPVIHYMKMESELMIYSKETSIQIQKSRKTKKYEKDERKKKNVKFSNSNAKTDMSVYNKNKNDTRD